ncbi:aryl-sulfate sulfotransferase [Aerococcus kribbianus]|uniref:Aryl-sulfate sulfotransferase n=1 Tax=Aerococcus kribbianus TaxID=2999064 RepID=A0A9X3JGJ1_9LACT|nr:MULTISPECIES: aryl-sulfate sulfotransferase [unclassified Aerococcus]MCZ0717306.1 aryl-sulfate sulfotransferase [Aerococcus sp. YH-aer221]MCZ0725594.1 aryl-sulfate sulfotransferase [Aerococcus sp. YH-aer222]
MKYLVLIMSTMLLASCQYLSGDFDDSHQETEVSAVEQVNPQTIDTTDYYDLDTQVQIAEEVNKLHSEDYNLETPLIIDNPFGTINNSLYVYMVNDHEDVTNLTYTVSTEGFSDFSQTPNNYDEEGNFEFTLLGLIPGEKNTVTFDYLDDNGNTVKSYQFTVTADNVKAKDYPNQMTITEEGDPSQLSEGLFLGHGGGDGREDYIYLIDNEGIIRGELETSSGRIENFIESNQDSYYFLTDSSQLVEMNGLGQIISSYHFPGYNKHHDFILTEDETGALILASEEEAETIEDIIVYIDLETGQYDTIIDLKDTLSGYYIPVMERYQADAQAELERMIAETGEIEVDEGAGGEYPSGYFDDEGQLNPLDWIHINSLDIKDGDELVLSSRESSSIIKLSNIYNEAQVDYIIGLEEVWEGTGYEDVLLDNIDNADPTGGQHTVKFVDNDDNTDNYQLSVFDNNYWRITTRPDLADFEPESLFTGFDADENAHSYYYQYEIDEANGEYRLTKEFELPYSSIVSSAQRYKDNIVTMSGVPGILGEYTQAGELIRQYEYDVPSFIYRMTKHDFNGFFFDNN